MISFDYNGYSVNIHDVRVDKILHSANKRSSFIKRTAYDNYTTNR